MRCARSCFEDGMRPPARDRHRPDVTTDALATGERPDWRALARIGLGQIDLFCARLSAAARIVLDIDDTDDPVHGEQQLALFNTHAGGNCFQPIHIFEARLGKPRAVAAAPRQAAIGRGGRAGSASRHPSHPRTGRRSQIWCAATVTTATPKCWTCWKRCTATTSSDWPSTRGLTRSRRPWRQRCAQAELSRTRPNVRRFTRLQYAAAQSWTQAAKVIARVEATEQGSDVRFIVTNLPGRAKTLYEKVYCARGRMENLIKDMKLYTRSDKTACQRWEANQFRLFLHMGAYWLLHELSGAAPKRSIWRSATFETIRCTFVKIAVRIQELKTRIKMALPSSYPHVQALTALATSIAALAP